MIVCQFI